MCDRALLALLLSCGLRRHELVQLELDSLQEREDHCAIVDLKGKAGHIRTVPIPSWVKDLLDDWLIAASISEGRIFRRVNKAGKISECAISEKAVWHVVRHYAANIGLGKLAPHDLRSYAEFRIMPNFTVVRAWAKVEPINSSA